MSTHLYALIDTLNDLFMITAVLMHSLYCITYDYLIPRMIHSGCNRAEPLTVSTAHFPFGKCLSTQQNIVYACALTEFDQG